MHWYRVACTCVAGGGLWLTEGQMLRAEELGDHLIPLVSCGALVAVPMRREVKAPLMVAEKVTTFALR